MPSYRPQIYNPQQGQFQRQPTESFTEIDGIVQPAIAQTLTASTAIAPIASTIAISSATAIALTATPAIAPGIDPNKFQILNLINTGNHNITLQDEAVLAGSGLRLFKNNWVIRPNRSLALLYRGDRWQQLFDGETLGDADILEAILRVDTDSAGINATTLQGINGGGFLKTANNLSDLSSQGAARNNIGADSPFWNADRIRGVGVSPIAPIAGQSLVFNSATNQYVPTTVASSGFDALTTIIYKDANWGLCDLSGQNFIWRSRDAQYLGTGGESATGRLEIGYLILKNTLVLLLGGGGSTNGNLKRVKIVRTSDSAVLYDLSLNILISIDTNGLVAASINTSTNNGAIVKIVIEDNDSGGSWSWISIDIKSCVTIL